VKNFLEENVVNIDDVILDFVNSQGFETLKVILKQKYIGQLQVLHNKFEEKDIIKSKAYLDVILSLCQDLELDVARILEERKEKSQTVGLDN